MKKYILFVFLLKYSLVIMAQQNISGIVNSYAPVTAISAGNVLSLGTGSGATHTWAVGDYVLIAQMTGSTDANAGHYDYAKVTAVSGSNITVTPLSGNSNLGFRYSYATEKVQLVWVPYDASGFIATNTVTPLPWNDSVGGIVALLTPGTIALNANINAACSGFAPNSTTLLSGSSIYYGGGAGGGSQAGGGGGSGGSYGVGGYPGGSVPATVANLGSYEGMGLPSLTGLSFYALGIGNGGSAGAGGGGGGGGASPSIGGCGGTTSNGVTSFSGGTGSINGVGGTKGTNSVSGNNAGGAGGGGSEYASGGGGASTSAGGGGMAGIDGGAGGAVWTYGNSGGGAGGAGLSNTYTKLAGAAYTLSTSNYKNFLNTTDPRILMGAPSQTAVSGGGIVLLQASTILGNGSTISTDGCTGPDAVSATNPAIGGSGAGTIIIDAATYSSLNVSAKGGTGGNGTIVWADTYGNYTSGGAGGGGGAVWVSSTTSASNLNSTAANPTVSGVTFNVAGGTGGTSEYSNKMSSYGGGGGCGGAGIVYTNPFSLVAFCTPPSFTATVTQATCTGSAANSNGTITLTGFTTGARYQYSAGSTFSTGIPATITAIPAGGIITNTLTNPTTAQVYTVRVYDPTDNTCYTDQQVTLNPTNCSVPCTSPNCITTITVKQN